MSHCRKKPLVEMEYSVNTRPLLQDSDTENEDLLTQAYEESLSTSHDEPLFKTPEPADRYNTAFIVFYVLGITTLLPWNFFITANDVSFFGYIEIYLLRLSDFEQILIFSNLEC